MKKFEYDILFHRRIKGNVIWYFASNPNKKVGKDLIKILNKLGAKGWEASSAGDLDGGAIAEVLLKREKGKR